MNTECVMLLTGTINPNSTDTLVLTDPDLRRAHYMDAIHFYLKNTHYPIVFVENSGESLKESFKAFGERIEFFNLYLNA